MRKLLTWLAVVAVLAGLSARAATPSLPEVVIVHCHEHDGEHHHHHGLLDLLFFFTEEHCPHDGQPAPEEGNPASPCQEHHHVIACSPWAPALEMAERADPVPDAGARLSLQSLDEATPEGPYPDRDVPPLI